MNRDDLTEKQLIKETYAATLQPERLVSFESFWEAYIDNKLLDSNGEKIDDAVIHSHFTMALGIVERIRHEREEENYLQTLVNSHPGMAFLVNHQGDIIVGNSEALTLIETFKNIRSLPLRPDSLESLRQWLKQGENRRAQSKSPFLFSDVILEPDDTTLSLFIAPVETTNHETYYLFTGVDFDVSEDVLPALQERFELTDAEAQVAIYISKGYSPADIADMRDTSLHTVRTQIKHLLSKTDSRDIANLVRKFTKLTAKFNAVTRQSERLVSTKLNENLIRIYNVILPDGRFMEYVEQGHPHGIPILQMHSVTNGVVLTNDAAQKAVLGGWRFITPSRPGYGNSDPNPTKTPDANVNAACEDFKYLLQHLNIDKTLILSGWAGCFSQRFSLMYPHMVKGILQTGSVPIWHRDHLKYMKSRHRTILKTSLYAPAAAPYMVRVAKALIDGGKGHLFVEEVERNSHIDLTALRTDAHLFDTIANGHRHNLRQGTQAFINDLKTLHRSWIEDSKKLKVPITVLRGSENADQPESAFEKYQAAVLHAQIKTVKNAGVYMYLTHFDRVLEEFDILNKTKLS